VSQKKNISDVLAITRKSIVGELSLKMPTTTTSSISVKKLILSQSMALCHHSTSHLLKLSHLHTSIVTGVDWIRPVNLRALTAYSLFSLTVYIEMQIYLLCKQCCPRLHIYRLDTEKQSWVVPVVIG